MRRWSVRRNARRGCGSVLGSCCWPRPGQGRGEISRQLRCTIGTASKWRVRYARDRLAGLPEVGGRGAQQADLRLDYLPLGHRHDGHSSGSGRGAALRIGSAPRPPVPPIPSVRQITSRLPQLTTSTSPSPAAQRQGRMREVMHRTVGSCPIAWCRSWAPRRVGPPYQAAMSGRLTLRSWLSGAMVSRLM